MFNEVKSILNEPETIKVIKKKSKKTLLPTTVPNQEAEMGSRQRGSVRLSRKDAKNKTEMWIWKTEAEDKEGKVKCHRNSVQLQSHHV